MTSEKLKEERVSQAYFGRLIGKSKMRVSQLIKAGLIQSDSGGVLLIASLKSWFEYQILKGHYSVAEFVSWYKTE